MLSQIQGEVEWRKVTSIQTVFLCSHDDWTNELPVFLIYGIPFGPGVEYLQVESAS